MHKTSTRINKAATIIIYQHGINFVSLPKVKQGGDFIRDGNKNSHTCWNLNKNRKYYAYIAHTS
jgi:hypothetical protein